MYEIALRPESSAPGHGTLRCSRRASCGVGGGRSAVSA
ncbi:hypothetical protein GJR88_05271 [Dietzia sp. DQ12-45-1b]|nr:hypothetical protein GJR88_05271 [Dietzia sp. DQ12-45-1b]